MMTLNGLIATFALSAVTLAAGVGASLPARSTIDAPAIAEAYTVDAVHSTVLFRVKHLNVANFYGNFRAFSGEFSLDPASAEGGSVRLEVKTDSIDTGNSKRDAHLKSADFFNVDQFPTASFISNSLKKTGEGKFEATGEFTLCGVTKTITVPIEHTGSGTHPRGGSLAGIEATFTIQRGDYGIAYMPDGLGSEVRLIVSLEGMRK